jgi:hypothetical protein
MTEASSPGMMKNRFLPEDWNQQSCKAGQLPMPKTNEPYSTLTCPECGHQSRELMPTDACQFYYDCTACGALLKPKAGDCCVFCSYGDVKCPPIQQGDPCCDSR